MGKNDYFKRGDYNRPCDICDAKRKMSQLQKTWDNFWVCAPHVAPGCWYVRQEQDFPPPRIQDLKPVPYSRPRAQPVYVQIPESYRWVWSTDPTIWGEDTDTWSGGTATYGAWESLTVETWDQITSSWAWGG